MTVHQQLSLIIRNLAALMCVHELVPDILVCVVAQVQICSTDGWCQASLIFPENEHSAVKSSLNFEGLGNCSGTALEPSTEFLERRL